MKLSRRSLFKSLFGLGLTAVVGGRVVGKSEDRSQPSRANLTTTTSDASSDASSTASSTVSLWIMEEQHILQARHRPYPVGQSCAR